MNFRIADTSTASLAKLTGDEQQAVKTTAFDLQISPNVRESLRSDVNRPFPKPESGRSAVINHLGDEVIKVFRVE